MPDLNTESTKVARTLEKWIYDLVHRYGIDAIRVDTVKHVRKDFWPGFVHAAGVAAMGEVLHGGECGVVERAGDVRKVGAAGVGGGCVCMS